jgi:hypothetical protein
MLMEEDMSNTQDQMVISGSPVSGVTTASLVTVTVVATLVGGVTGLFLSGKLDPLLVTIIAGLASTLLAGAVRNYLLTKVWDAAGVHDSGTPPLVVAYAAIASLAGSGAAYELTNQLTGDNSSLYPGVTGMLAGAISAGLLGLLMVTYPIKPVRDASS